MNSSSESTAAEPLILQRRRGAVAFLTLNRPAQYNSLSEQMLAALHAALDEIAADSSARVVVLSGAGKAFCAGHDLKQMKANPSLEYYPRLFDDGSRWMMQIPAVPQPVIARVHGIATRRGLSAGAPCAILPWPQTMRVSRCPA